MSDLADRRALACVRFFDLATGSMIADPLRVESEGRWSQNRTGDWVLREHPALPGYDASFAEPTGLPAAGSISLRAVVRDPNRRWLTRAFNVALPRLPKHAQYDLYSRIPITLGPSPALPLRQSWGMVRVHVRFAPTPGKPEGTPIEGALVRIATVGGEARCMTLSDTRGEAAAPVPRIPLYEAGEGTGAVLEPRIAHRLQVVVDLAATDRATGRRLAGPLTAVADPDDLWRRRTSLSFQTSTVLLSIGKELARTVDLPA